MQIYLQGCLIHCPDEGTLHSLALEDAVVLQAVNFAALHALSLVAYSAAGDRIVSRQTDAQSDRLLHYGEPPPESVGE